MDFRFALQPNTIIDEKYRIDNVIGSGGFGITYAALDVGLGKAVAIKEYFPAQFGFREADHTVRARSASEQPIYERLRSSFLREARTLATFDHAAIVRVLNAFESRGTAYMIMNLERGPSLKSWLSKLDRPPLQSELDSICGPLLSALEVLHSAQFLHRDIAPDNIIVRSDGTPVLLDFGAARRVMGEMTGTMTGIVKKGFSPPEQYAADGRSQGPWTDIYAMAATLYRAISGRTPAEATARILDDQMPPASDFANGDYRVNFLNAIDWALRLQPSDRPQDIRQWRAKLLQDNQDIGVPWPNDESTRSLSLPNLATGAAENENTPHQATLRNATSIGSLAIGRWPLVGVMVAVIIGTLFFAQSHFRSREAISTAIHPAVDQKRELNANPTVEAQPTENQTSAGAVHPNAQSNHQALVQPMTCPPEVPSL